MSGFAAGEKSQLESLADIGRALLATLGEDVQRPGLVETPRRFAEFWSSFINYDDKNTNTSFNSVTTDQMVVVSGIRVWSMCEHHLLPFWCDVAIGYIAEERVLGLSKFGRIAKLAARRLQLQERLVDDIANGIAAAAKTNNVAVLAQGVHTCMVMRGIEIPAVMTSSVMRGIFKHGPSTRSEFIDLVKSAESLR